MEEITEDRVKVLAHEAIDKRIEDFRDQFCDPKYEQLQKDRDERGRKIERLYDSLGELTKCMNGKFNKMYYLLFGVLVSIIVTLISVLAK